MLDVGKSRLEFREKRRGWCFVVYAELELVFVEQCLLLWDRKTVKELIKIRTCLYVLSRTRAITEVGKVPRNFLS